MSEIKCPKCGSEKYYYFVHQIEGSYWYCPDCQFRQTNEQALQAEIAALRAQVTDQRNSLNNYHDILGEHAKEFSALREENGKLKENGDFLRESIGECHLMLSRNTSEFQLHNDWENTSLPFRVANLIIERDRMRKALEEIAEHPDCQWACDMLSATFIGPSYTAHIAAHRECAEIARRGLGRE